MDSVHTAKWEMVEAGGRTAQSFGLSRLFGQIYMLLYLSDEPLGLDFLAEQLGVSKASVSIASRQLESWGAVRRIWKKGDRRDFYTAETDFRNLIHGGLMTSLNKKLESARVQIQRSLDMLEKNGSSDDKIKFLKQRLNEAESRRSKIARLLNNPLVKKLL